MNWIKSTKNIIKILLLSLVVLLVSVLLIIAAEIFAQKILALGSPIVYQSNLLWGYSPVANQKKLRFRGATVTINDVGVRATTDWIGIENEKVSPVVFIGDSITYGGSYIDDNELFSTLACSNIAQYLCYNAGVNAYGVLNMVARSRFDKRIEDASVVIFTLLAGDFFRGLQDSNTAHFMLKEPNVFFPAIHEILNFLSNRYSLKNFLGKCCEQEQSADEIKNQHLFSIDWGLEILEEEIMRLKSAGKKVFVALSPSKASFEANARKGYTQYVFDSAKVHELNIIDLNDVLNASGLSANELFYDEVHYEIGAHRVVGDFFRQQLQSF